MALQQKKKWAQLKVGLLAVASLCILAFLIFLMTSTKGLFTSRSDIFMYLDDSAAVAEGAPVRVNGITAGKVAHVELSGVNEPNRIVKVTLEVDDDFLRTIPIDSRAAIAAENLLGTKYINIKKGTSATMVKPGDEIKSLDTREFDEVVQQGYSALASLDGILKKVDAIVNSIQVGEGTIGKLLSDDKLYKQLLDISTEIQTLTKTLNSDQGTLGKLMHDESLYNDARGTISDVRGTVSRVNTLVDGLQQGQGTAGKLLKDPALYDETRATIGDVRKLLAGLNEGQGTVGKLLKSDELHDQLRTTMGRLDLLLEKINNGQGTIGQLVVNPALYDSLDTTTRELNGLLKDFRANPKKFLRIKLAIF
jgi:phospholipid/cholesterol/gamma-HCH transport system substrate-binding protein